MCDIHIYTYILYINIYIFYLSEIPVSTKKGVNLFVFEVDQIDTRNVAQLLLK